MVVYALCGVLSELAGVLLVEFHDAADLGNASPFILPSVAAVVIGGTSIFGGLGGYSGTIPGRAHPHGARLAAHHPQRLAAVRQIVYGRIVLSLAAIYARASARD